MSLSASRRAVPGAVCAVRAGARALSSSARLAADAPRADKDDRKNRSWSDSIGKRSDGAESNKALFSAMSTMRQMDYARMKSSEQDTIAPRFFRNFKQGVVYSPVDLSYKKLRPKLDNGNDDRVAAVGIDPLTKVKDPHFLSDFITPMGNIKSAQENNVSKKTQRRLVKAIKRARAAGLLSTVHQTSALSYLRLDTIGSRSN
ncbi:mitochondrial 37S ribosomal protein bS18m [Dipodascopsis tothii]|uniref:mitochondrial 37S ribosomal protein bS18m n=1 Tax=Dipodascopsis tothii TaxID=44089 RepID=UPI0034CD4467